MATVKEKDVEIEQQEYDKVEKVIHEHTYHQKSDDSIEFKYKTSHGTNTIKVFGNNKKEMQDKIKDYKKIILKEAE